MVLTPQLLEKVLELSSDAVMVTDARLDEAGPRIVYVNRAFETMTGYRRDEVLGSSPRLLQGEKSDPDLLKRLSAALAERRHFEGETWNYRKSGEPFLMWWTMDPVPDERGDVSHFVAIQEDVTERQERSRRMRDLERIVDLQREVVTGGLDLQRVRQRVVDAAMQISGAEAAVVEEVEGEELVYRAVAGRAHDALGIRIPLGESLSGMCYRKKATMLCDDTRSDDRVTLKEAALRIGFVSGVLVPLLQDQRCYGVLKVYSARPSAFSDDDRQLLEIASGILAAALFSAASFEHEVQRRTMLVDAIPILVSYIDRERRYQEVNAAYEDWFGLKASDIRGKFVWEVLGEAAYEKVRPYLDAALGGEEVSYEADIPYRKGGKRTVLAQYQPHLAHDGSVTGTYAVVRDLTSVKQAETDFLTGLLNRRKFEETAGYLLKKAARYGQPVSLILLDLDHFKRINDRFGHLVGDEVLKAFGRYLGRTLRGIDVAARWGGEEFIILAPDTPLDQATQLAERICAEVRSRSFGEVDGVTVSVGLTRARDDETLGQLLERVDRTLYRAKQEGRDRVAVAD